MISRETIKAAITEKLRTRLPDRTKRSILLASLLNHISKNVDRESVHKLNEVMLAEIEKYHPPAYRGEYIKIKYVTQLPTKVPSFAFFCNHPDYIKGAYKNYLENRMRANFPLSGVPINIFFRKK